MSLDEFSQGLERARVAVNEFCEKVRRAEMAWMAQDTDHAERIEKAHGVRRVVLDRKALADGFLFLVDEQTGALITEISDLALVQPVDGYVSVEATFIMGLSKPEGE